MRRAALGRAGLRAGHGLPQRLAPLQEGLERVHLRHGRREAAADGPDARRRLFGDEGPVLGRPLHERGGVLRDLGPPAEVGVADPAARRAQELTRTAGGPGMRGRVVCVRRGSGTGVAGATSASAAPLESAASNSSTAAATSASPPGLTARGRT